MPGNQKIVPYLARISSILSLDAPPPPPPPPGLDGTLKNVLSYYKAEPNKVNNE